MSQTPPDAWPAGERLEWWDDATRTHYDFTDTPPSTRPYTAEEIAAAEGRDLQRVQETNRTTLVGRARAALTANRDFLAVQAPTNAQTLTQVRALTRQMNAALRLLVGDLTGTD